VRCKHWSDCGIVDGGKCALHKKTCSFGVCAICPDSDPKNWVDEFRKNYKPAKKTVSIKKAKSAMSDTIKEARNILDSRDCGNLGDKCAEIVAEYHGKISSARCSSCAKNRIRRQYVEMIREEMRKA
jgi:hypothetical protein